MELALNEQARRQKRCFLGDHDYLVYGLKDAILKAKSIDMNVAFLMESGVRLLHPELEEIAAKNIPIRILTGNYLNITQPQALYYLKSILGDKVDLRFYNVPNRSFHPKAYIFEYENDGDIFIGSSNVSQSALMYGIEWNYRISKSEAYEDFILFKEKFEDLFLNYSTIIDEMELKRYSKQWKRPSIYKTIEGDKDVFENPNIIAFPSPRGAQIEALYELKNTREEGFDKGLVAAATGIGKTYLAAFDSQNFKKVLFIAHREEILSQAKRSFENVRQDCKTGFFSGNTKDKDCEVLFATVQTLGQPRYLCKDYFDPKEFDYIIIDEFHHAAAKTYKQVIDYFHPAFLLGLTATPYRMDNKDVLALCDYNLVYEIDLTTAINKGLLVPFRYYGIYDETDYGKIEYKNGKYNEKQLEKALMIHKRADLICNHYKKYKSKRALGFCSSRNHAEYMAQYFINQGIEACAVHSGEKSEYVLDRGEAILKLQQGDMQVIFSVDMFNEGLDVPSVDLVMFLRPTESETVFLQQLGRGLRKSKGKEYLNVLDFIGNFKKAGMLPSLLSGKSRNDKENTKKRTIQEEEYPQDCIVDFDFRIMDIIKRQEQARQKIKDLVIEEYYRIKEDMGHRPSRVEMFTYMNDNLYDAATRKGKENIFKNYLGFLNELDELNEEEKKLLGTKGAEFIHMIEKTSMSKTYKMPLLLAFVEDGKLKMKIDEEDIYRSFKEFYSRGSNGIDLARHKSTADYKQWGKEEYVRLAKNNPMKFLLKSESEFFYMENEQFCVNGELKSYQGNREFVVEVLDAVEYRVQKFYRERLEGREEGFE